MRLLLGTRRRDDGDHRIGDGRVEVAVRGALKSQAEEGHAELLNRHGDVEDILNGFCLGHGRPYSAQRSQRSTGPQCTHALEHNTTGELSAR